MPRKKQPKYGDMSKMLEELQEKVAGERARMAGVMCEGLLTGDAARRKAREEGKQVPDSEAGQEMVPEPVPKAGFRHGII